MPQKGCERCIFHVMTFAFYCEMPQIEDFLLRFIFGFQISHVFLFEMPNFSMVKNFKMPCFSYLNLKIGKMGQFKNF